MKKATSVFRGWADASSVFVARPGAGRRTSPSVAIALALQLVVCAGSTLAQAPKEPVSGGGGSGVDGAAVKPPIVAPLVAPQFVPGGGGGVDDAKPMPLPPVSDAVTQLLNQDYLSDAEKLAIRVRHGVWDEADLTSPLFTPALRASASLIRGAYLDSVFDDAAVPAEDRAEASLLAGRPERVEELLAGATSMRAARLRAESLCDLGKFEDAKAALAPILTRLRAGLSTPAGKASPAGEKIESADELVEAVRGVLVLARLKGPENEPGADFRACMTLLAQARDRLDRLNWQSRLCEAQLLHEKDNFPEAGKALEEALTLNPRNAQAWALLGHLAVAGFDLPRADRVAARLDELAKPGVSPEAAMIRAAARLRQVEGAQAEALLAPALEKFPTHRGVRSIHAAAAAARFDFEEADRRLSAFDAISPGSPMAYLAVGKAMAEARQYAEASTYLRTAAERSPAWPEPIIELGLSEMQAGRNDEARVALEKARTLDRFNPRAENSLTLLKELATYTSNESEHFIVRCKPGEDEILAKEMLPVLERIFARVTGNGPGGIDHKPDHKTVIELYPNHRWFAVRIAGMPAIHTIAAATGPLIAMESPREGPGHLTGPYDWARVVQHEYTHTVTLSRTKNRLPHWFTEASAVYLEDSPRDYSTLQLLTKAYETNTLFDLDSINIAFVRPKRPIDRGLAYAQGHWMYQFMMERFGARTPLDLMDRYAKGEREDEAFKAVLGVGRNEFLAQFRVYAKEQLIAWGMSPSEANPDVPTLLARSAGDARSVKGIAEGGGDPTRKTEDPNESDEPTDEQLDAWLVTYPANPFVLEYKVRRLLAANGNKATPEIAPLLERYAASRPDPLPHKLLAAMLLAQKSPDANEGAQSSEARAIPHLEWLDAREQGSTAYAQELAKIYLSIGQPEKAAVKAARATQIAPYDPRVREFAATIALRMKDIETAERHIRALTVLEPDRAVHKQRLEALGKLK